MLFIIDSLLSGAALELAQSLMQRSKFIDGVATAKVSKSKKNNLELEVNENYLAMVEVLDAAVDASPKIKHRLLPRFRTYPIVNRYDEGMFYARHIDAPIQGNATQVGRVPGRFGQNFIRADYSMTLFLSEPGSYDGGELEIIVLEEKKIIKLRAGSAVCYSTGLPHTVRPVTRGYRAAAIYWFQSMIRDGHVRRVLWDMYELEIRLKLERSDETAAQIADIRSNMVRYLAEI